MTEDVRNSIGVLISGANREGNISFLEEQEANGELNPLLITEYERWNYLHRVNIYCSAPIETMNFYISRGVDINALDNYGMTPLHYAVKAQNPQAVKVLLEAGADPTLKNQDGSNAMWQTFKKIPLEADMEILQLFLKHGISAYQKNDYGVSMYSALESVTETRNRKGEITQRPYIQDMLDYIDENYPREEQS